MEQPAVHLNVNLDESEDEIPSKANGVMKSKSKGKDNAPKQVTFSQEVDDSDAESPSGLMDDLEEDPEDELDDDLEAELSPNEFDQPEEGDEEASDSEEDEEEEEGEDPGPRAGPSTVTGAHANEEEEEEEVEEVEEVEEEEGDAAIDRDFEGGGEDEGEDDDDEDDDDEPELPSDLSGDELDDNDSMAGLDDFVDRLTARSKQPVDPPEKDVNTEKKLRYIPSVPVPAITNDDVGLRSSKQLFHRTCGTSLPS